MNQTQLALLNATMDIVAENGLDNLSMRQVTNRVGVSSAMVYVYFESKESLLYQCFMHVNRQFEALFHDMALPENPTREQAVEFIHQWWLRFFRFQAKNGRESVFYYSYQTSAYFQAMLREKDITQQHFYADFVRPLFDALDHLHVFDAMSPTLIWIYLLETTGCYARRTITQKLVISEQDQENIWRLLLGGLSAFFAD